MAGHNGHEFVPKQHGALIDDSFDGTLQKMHTHLHTHISWRPFRKGWELRVVRIAWATAAGTREYDMNRAKWDAVNSFVQVRAPVRSRVHTASAGLELLTQGLSCLSAC